jgi:predicted house-cleaning NTP pyrophosphatase (Maf/HAM1 superfamily)
MSLLAWGSIVERLIDSNRLQIILASNSPRRKEILSSLLLTNRFLIEPSSFEENLDKSQFDFAHQYCLATAKGKAHDVTGKISARNQLEHASIGKFMLA